MVTASVSEFKKDIQKYLDEVTDNFETLILHRPNGKEVVVISLDKFNAINATQHELSSKINKNRLDNAIAKDKAGKRIPKQLMV